MLHAARHVPCLPCLCPLPHPDSLLPLPFPPVQCFALPVFFKQRSMQMFPAWAFTSPAAILRLPFSMIDATLFSITIYWLTGLAPNVNRFFFFWGFHILFSQVLQGPKMFSIGKA